MSNRREKFTLDLQGKKYFQVAGRVLEFREALGLHYGVETEIVMIPLPEKVRNPETKKAETIWVDTPHVKATIRQIVDGCFNGPIVSQGMKRVTVKSGPAGNFPVEIAETGAVGRALALIGFGTEELSQDDEEDLADAPQ